MKAAYLSQFGDLKHLKVIEVEKPTIDENEILVQVETTTVQSADWRLRTLQMPPGMGFIAKIVFGFNKPRKPILGTELAGKVTAVGQNVTEFKIGDEVVAAVGTQLGAHAEFAKVPKNGTIAFKPSQLSFQQVVAIPFGGITALDYLKYKTQLKKNETILIDAASGSVGVAAIQVAKILGAQVTAVCSEANFELVRSLGADHVIDYSKNDILNQTLRYDVVFDVLGNRDLSKLLNLCNDKGRLVLISASLWQMLAAPFHNLFSRKKIVCGVADESRKNLQELLEWAKAGKYKPVIGQEFRFENISEAHALVQSRHKRGNIVVNVSRG